MKKLFILSFLEERPLILTYLIAKVHFYDRIDRFLCSKSETCSNIDVAFKSSLHYSKCNNVTDSVFIRISTMSEREFQ